MADEREGAGGPRRNPANRKRTQSGGREANAPQPLNAAEDNEGPERYPAVDRTDAVEPAGRARRPAGEPRSFEAAADAPSAFRDDDEAEQKQHWLGPQGDPAEGKRSA
jgi:hypothetical protein